MSDVSLNYFSRLHNWLLPLCVLILGIQQLFIAVRNGVIMFPLLLLSFPFTGTNDISANSAQCYLLVTREQAGHISTSLSPLPVQIQNILYEVRSRHCSWHRNF
jgi:hypothetical protein